jgi:transcriptional regulator with XRE-family HTH domain
MLRDWRRRRRLSQFELALESGVSARHLSFVENGRSRPSAEMVLHLAEQLDVPLRDRNQLLLAAGYAPAFAERELDAPEMGPVREAIELVLRGHEPYPALVVDRHHGLVSANRALAVLIAGVPEHMLEPPVNVLRLSLHPEGLAPRIVNLGEWRELVLSRLAREAVPAAIPRWPPSTTSSLPTRTARQDPASTPPSVRSQSRSASGTATPSSRSSAR